MCKDHSSQKDDDNININSREFKHLNKDRLCYCCDTLQESKDQINVYKIEERIW
jgi:hypothetical protein